MHISTSSCGPEDSLPHWPASSCLSLTAELCPGVGVAPAPSSSPGSKPRCPYGYNLSVSSLEVSLVASTFVTELVFPPPFSYPSQTEGENTQQEINKFKKNKKLLCPTSSPDPI